MNVEYKNLMRKINQCRSILNDVTASKDNLYKKELLEDLLTEISWIVYDMIEE